MSAKRMILKTYLLLFPLIALCSFSPSNSDNMVYICVKGEVYHSKKSCRGLKNVKSDIIAVKRNVAETKYKRRPCKICY